MKISNEEIIILNLSFKSFPVALQYLPLIYQDLNQNNIIKYAKL